MDYDIEAVGEATEHYSVAADSEEEARAKFESGEIGPAYYTEVSNSEIRRIEKND